MFGNLLNIVQCCISQKARRRDHVGGYVNPSLIYYRERCRDMAKNTAGRLGRPDWDKT